MHGRMKPAYGEIKCSCGANSVDCHVQERVWMIARTVESGEQVMKPWIDYYMIVFSMVTEDPEWHGNLPNLRRGRMHDDMVKQLYACGSVAIWTETETELTCDTERNTLKLMISADTIQLWLYNHNYISFSLYYLCV